MLVTFWHGHQRSFGKRCRQGCRLCLCYTATRCRRCDWGGDVGQGGDGGEEEQEDAGGGGDGEGETERWRGEGGRGQEELHGRLFLYSCFWEKFGR